MLHDTHLNRCTPKGPASFPRVTAWRISHVGCLCCLLLGGAGCATHALWSNDPLVRFYEPASNPELRFYQDEREEDFVVAYNESLELHDHVRRRAYYVLKEEGRVRTGEKPQFTRPDKLENLRSVAMLSSKQMVEPGSNGTFAVLVPGEESFKLYRGGDFVGDFELPVYKARSGAVARVLLTPVTVVADVTVIGGYLFLYMWASAGGQMTL